MVRQIPTTIRLLGPMSCLPLILLLRPHQRLTVRGYCHGAIYTTFNAFAVTIVSHSLIRMSDTANVSTCQRLDIWDHSPLRRQCHLLANRT